VNELPDPLTPVDSDLRRFDALPLEIIHPNLTMLAGESNDTVYRAAMALTIWSWQLKPAGSFENHPNLFRAANVSRQWWARNKQSVLGYFVLCNDGRWYHPGIARWVARNGSRRNEVSRDLGVSGPEWQRMRLAVFQRDNFTCQYCGATDKALDCDHVVPLSRGGITHEHNLVTACFPCNRSKGDKLIEEWAA
jgi:5-methylcytosine-specific restriction endonuclease McrA